MNNTLPNAQSLKHDIVIVGLQAWYTDIGSNCKSIALELSKNNRVLYINMPLDRKTIIKSKNDPNIKTHLDIIKKKENNLIPVKENLWNYYPRTILFSINWLPSTNLFSFFNKINNRKFAREIRRATGKIGFKSYILFNDNDIFRTFYLKEMLRPLLYIYYSRDNLLGVDYWKKHGRKIEPLHIAKADIALANSIYLANYLRRHNPSSHYIGQGCDVALFNAARKYTVPEDIQPIAHPIIGYVGALNTIRIDIRIIKIIAQSRPQWSMVLIGPEDEFFKQSDLHNYSNIHFLGKKPLAELPAYIANFDVCINPQLVNDVTIGNYPLKIDEYLAMGKSVVATKTDALQIFGDLVYLADHPEDYPGLIDIALSNNNPDVCKKRIELAQKHTWENSVDHIYSAIKEKLHS